MPLFGLDISHHQGSNFPMHLLRGAGVEYIILKATEGSGFVDSRFQRNLTEARKAGLVVAAYHYQRSNVSVASQIANIKSHVPRDVPIIPDVEHNSGGVDITRALIDGLQAEGYRVPLLYLPRWYWQQIGRPFLGGFPFLWSSRYPDNVQGSILDEYADVPSYYWEGYGGIAVGMLQFTSSGRVPGYGGPVDVNAFRGSREDLVRLFGGVSIPETPKEEEEDTSMELTPGLEQSRTLVVPAAAKKFVISRGFAGLNVLSVKFFGPHSDEGVNTLFETSGAQWVDPARPYIFDVPATALTAEVLYSYEDTTGQHLAVAGFRN